MLKEIAAREGISLRTLEKNVGSGSAVVVKNPGRNIRGIAIGAGTHVKVNANVGLSPEKSDISAEIEKAETAVDCGADTVMDLSVGGDLDEARRRIIKAVGVPVGTVPVYQAFTEKKIDMSADDLFRVVEKHCKDGADFLTLHCGITRDVLEDASRRLIPITSRGGCFLAAWMIKNQEENPLYAEFDKVLEIAREYETVISLGDALRPACIADASDAAQIRELVNLGRLTKKARDAGVQVMIEGPGHVPLDQIEANMRLGKRICANAPFYVLGPLVTDIACGYDHITGAIGGAIAAMHGADFLCYVTPSEHLGLPDREDVRNGVIASRIAAHAADIVRLKDDAIDRRMSEARREVDWDAMFSHCIDPKVRERYPDLAGKDACTMCGSYCALKILREYLGR